MKWDIARVQLQPTVWISYCYDKHYGNVYKNHTCAKAISKLQSEKRELEW